ncbi:MAG: hypothetical protein FWF57_08225 [Defluviitaleaceae bacterium]|nr:hypothetical protein [Defluviitaleaceae bacterium]
MKYKKHIAFTLSLLFAISPFSITTAFAEDTNVEIAEEIIFVHPNDLTLIEGNWYNRINLWREDIEQFRDAIVNSHPRFWDDEAIVVPTEWLFGQRSFIRHPWNTFEDNVEMQERFLNGIDSLIFNIGILSDIEIFTELRRLATFLEDGHFVITLFDENSYVYPIAFKWLGGDGGGFYLLSAAEEFEEYLNKVVVQINGIDIGSILDKFYSIGFSENRFSNRFFLEENLNSPYYLAFLGFFDEEIWGIENNEIILTLEDSEQNRHDMVLTLDDLFLIDEDNRDGVVDFPAISVDIEELPRFLRRQGYNSFYILEDYGILYIVLEEMDATLFNFSPQEIEEEGFDLVMVLDEVAAGITHLELWEIFNQLDEAEDDDEIFDIVNDEFWNRIDNNLAPNQKIVDAINSGIVHTVIIDGRGNGGGNLSFLVNLFRFLDENIEDDNLFYFKDIRSFSAASVAAVITEYLGGRTVGDPTGQNLIFHGTARGDDVGARVADVILNNSRIYIQIPNFTAHLEQPDSYLGGIIINDVWEFIRRSPFLEQYAIWPTIDIDYTLEDWLNLNDPLLEHIKDLVNN